MNRIIASTKFPKILNLAYELGVIIRRFFFEDSLPVDLMHQFCRTGDILWFSINFWDVSTYAYI
jgi:hypothetical protein